VNKEAGRGLAWYLQIDEKREDSDPPTKLASPFCCHASCEQFVPPTSLPFDPSRFIFFISMAFPFVSSWHSVLRRRFFQADSRCPVFLALTNFSAHCALSGLGDCPRALKRQLAVRIARTFSARRVILLIIVQRYSIAHER
jgi:hypothetical protein